MKPTDSNLDAEEYFKYYVADEIAQYHYNNLLLEIDALQHELYDTESQLHEIKLDLENAYDKIELLELKLKYE